MRTTYNLIYTIVILILFSFALNGQRDSLLAILQSAATFEAKHKAAGQLYWTYLYADTEFSDSITTHAIYLAERADQDSLRCIALHMKANVKLVKAEYDSSLIYAQRQMQVAARNDFEDRQAATSALKGLIYYYTGDFNAALESHFAALEIQSRLGENARKLKTLNNIGICYERLNEGEKALTYYDQAYELTPKDDAYGRASLLTNMANIYVQSRDYEKAKLSYITARSLMNSSNHMSLLDDIDSGVANVYLKTGDLDQASNYAQKVLERVQLSGDYFRQVRTLELMATIYFQRGSYKKAIEMDEAALAIAQEKNIGETFLNLYASLKKTYQAVGRDDLALVALDSVLSIKEGIYNKEKQLITDDMNMKYQSSLKDQELIKGQQDISQKTYQRNIALGGFFLLLAGVGFVWQRLKNMQLVQQKTGILQKQKIADLEKERKILTMSSMIEGQEKERYRIAQELHDGLGSLLSSVKAHFSIIQSEIKQLEKLNAFEKAQTMMDNACEEVRRISHNLMPPILTAQGLSSAVRNLISEYQLVYDLSFDMDVQDIQPRLSTDKEIVLYRISQELLTNIRKHASARNVDVSLYDLEENVQLIIEDDGVGFDADKISGGLGLVSIHSRVEMLGGYVDIDSSTQRGSIISVSIPK